MGNRSLFFELFVLGVMAVIWSRSKVLATSASHVQISTTVKLALDCAVTIAILSTALRSQAVSRSTLERLAGERKR